MKIITFDIVTDEEICYNMSNEKRKEQKMDIRKHRFQPNMSTPSKVFLDKKRKSNSRRELNKKTKESW